MRAPGDRPVVRRSLPLLLLAAAAIVGACLSPNQAAPTAVVSAVPVVTPALSVSAAPSSEAPSTAPSVAPTESPTQAPTETPSEASPSPSGSGAAGSVDGCSGNDSNRAFFASAAAAFQWPVYCAVLPARWNVVTGSFKGGKLEISYRGPDGATFALHEGAFCAVGADCVPAGSDAGSVTFGDRMTTLVHAYDGSLAAAVDRGQKISWMAIGQNLDDTTFGSFLAALIRLD
jgi:hypothetical protein